MTQAKQTRRAEDAHPSPEHDHDSETATYPIGVAIERALKRYFKDLNGTAPCDLYRLVMNEAEKPLLRTVMSQTGGNSSRAAEMLGINRNTLRKKLRQHALNDQADNGPTDYN